MRQKTTVLRVPEAIPDRSWVVNTLIWADKLSAYWPHGSFDAHNPDDEKVLEELHYLQRPDVDLFEPRHVGSESIGASLGSLQQQLTQFATIPEPWVQEPPPFMSHGVDDRATAIFDVATADRFLYADKLPREAVELLRKNKLISAPLDSGAPGHLAADPRLLPLLLTEVAANETRITPGLCAAPGNQVSTAQMTAPRHGTPSVAAVAMKTGSLPRIRKDIELNRLLDVVASDAFIGYRTKYLEALDKVWRDDSVDGHLDSSAQREIAKQVRSDFESAERGFIKTLAQDKVAVIELVSGIVVSVITGSLLSAFTSAGLAVGKTIYTRSQIPPFVRHLADLQRM